MKQAAVAIGCSYQAVYKWPEILSEKITDRVVAAAFRIGKIRSDDELPTLFTQGASNSQSRPPTPEIPPDLQTAAVMLKGLLGKFADEEAIAWFFQLPPKNRAEIFEIHDCITTGLCIEELNRIKSVTNGDPKNDFANE